MQCIGKGWLAGNLNVNHGKLLRSDLLTHKCDLLGFQLKLIQKMSKTNT